MFESFLYSVNTVFPIFIIVALGWVLLRIKLITPEFTAVAERLVFKIALPVMLFTEVASADFETVFDGRFILFCCAGILSVFLVLCAAVPLFIKSDDRRGAFIQGIYRSNFAILGVPLAQNMFGEEGMAQIAIVMPFTIFLFNVFAVLILSIYAPKEAKLTPRQFLRQAVKNIVTNPLIIAVTAGVPFMLLGIEFPAVVSKSLGYISDTVMPLALICIGANFRFEALRGRIGTALAASLLKVIAVPATMVCIAVMAGFRGVRLGVILILFGAPTAVTSYIMAKNMKSDHELAGQIILLTTLMCIATLFAGVFILRTLSLI